MYFLEFITTLLVGSNQLALAIDNPPFEKPEIRVQNSFPIGIMDSGINYNDPTLKPYLVIPDHQLSTDFLGWDFNMDDQLPFDGPTLSEFKPLTPQNNKKFADWFSENIPALTENSLKFIRMLVSPNEQGHGTHVSGIAISSCGNRCSIVPLRIFGQNLMTIEYVLDAIAFARKHKIKIINMSFGFKVDLQSTNHVVSPQIDKLYNAMKNAEDILFVVAAGNDNTYFSKDKTCFYPACFRLTNVITVGAVDDFGELADFSNYDPEFISVYAQGVDVESQWFDGTRKKLSGTSMATPFVTGLIADIWNDHPDVSPVQIARAFLKAVPYRDITYVQRSSSGKNNSPFTHTHPTKVVLKSDMLNIKETMIKNLLH